MVTECKGEQTHQNYGVYSASDVIDILKWLHLQGVKAWLEVE